MSAAIPDPPAGQQTAGQQSTGLPAAPIPETPARVGPLPIVPRTPAPPVNLTFSADGLVFLGVAGWLLWRKVLRGLVMQRVGALLGSAQDARYVVELLAQMAVMTGAQRVALGTFYNPQLASGGYGFTRATLVSCYVAPGRLPLDVEARDMPMERIRNDLDDLIANSQGHWRFVRAGVHLPTPCRDYLMRNRIAFLYGRLVMLEGLPIGVINVQFDDPASLPLHHHEMPHLEEMEHLYQELSRVVRARMLRPPLWRRVFNSWAGH
ncbi:MAG: hypothetical protein ACRC1L_10630 [Prochlorococcaceae cyanobacterium]